MTRRRHSDSADRLLWRKLRAALDRRDGAGEIDPALIAAYLDGGLRPAEREAVESWLAVTPEAMDTLVAARDVLADAREVPVPDAVLQAGYAALPARLKARTQAQEKRSAFAGIFRMFEWSAVAALLLGVCVVGFNAGTDSAGEGSIRPIEIAAAEEQTILSSGAPQDGLFDPDAMTLIDGGDV